MKRIKGQIRQGDVLLNPVNEEPPPGLPLQTEVVLALGECERLSNRRSLGLQPAGS